jgi:hypothetical protein
LKWREARRAFFAPWVLTLAAANEPAPNILRKQHQQQRSRHHHVPVEGEGCGELAVEESGQGARAAAGRTRRKMKEMSPQAEIWTARQRFR